MSNQTLQLITQEQSDMIIMLLRGESITDIAKRLNRSRQTIYDWMKLDYVKAEVDKRRQELTHQGNTVILKDLVTYINNIKSLANDNSDKRVQLAANQYLINRIYGTPTVAVDVDNKNADQTATDVSKIEQALDNLRMNHWKK